MKKAIVYSLAGILTAGIMVSCSANSVPSNEPQPTTQSSAQPAAEKSAQATPAASPVSTSPPSPEDFTTGVFVDLDRFDNPLLTKEIKSLMNTTLDALAHKKEDAFRSVFKDEHTADVFMYLFGNDYSFDTIGNVEQDTKGRVVVQIIGKFKDKDGTEIKDFSPSYYFLKDANNVWSLQVID